MSMALYRNGAASYLNVVTAQDAALVARNAAIVIHTRELDTEIALMFALGGGWTVDSPSPKVAEASN